MRIKLPEVANLLSIKFSLCNSSNLRFLHKNEQKIPNVKLTCVRQKSEMFLEQVDHKPLIRARSIYRDFYTDFPVR